MLSPQFKASAGKAAASAKTITAYFVADDATLPSAAKGAAAAVKEAGFKGKPNETLVIPGNPYMVLVGVGAGKALTELKLAEAGGSAVAAALGAKRTHLNIVVDKVKGCKLTAADIAAQAAYGAKLRSYRFDKYRTVSDKDAVKLKTITVITKDAAGAKRAFTPLGEIAEGVKFTRDVVSEPGNILYPESYAEECKKLTKLGVKVEVLTRAQMEKLGMGALLGVAQGSAREAKMVIMQWHGGKKGDKPVALVGKGVTFDTGGISIKPSGGMEEMKFDMGGSGTVVGTMRALAGRKAKVNVVGVIGLVENMPDGNAQRPGDVVTSMSGQTIEVLNTDAEGRLVLADALWYTQDRFKPKAMVDLATLTGAILVALGSLRAGLFSNNDKVADTLTTCGLAHGEWMWRFPLADDYDKTLNCDVADMANISPGREAGSITAAQFLQRFVNHVPWAHLDIAGTAWNKKDTPLAPKGATGYGVRLLNDWVEKHYG